MIYADGTEARVGDRLLGTDFLGGKWVVTSVYGGSIMAADLEDDYNRYIYSMDVRNYMVKIIDCPIEFIESMPI